MSWKLLGLRVQLVSPARPGGCKRRELDSPPSLRPPAVRGMLRFWSRALGGPKPRDLEAHLWGDTKLGQRVAILAPQSLVPSREPYTVLQRGTLPDGRERKAVTLPMLAPGQTAVLRFRIPGVVDLREIQAVVWTWLHLGTIGWRARRGYGSLLWCPEPGDLLGGFVDFDPAQDLADPSKLAAYLKRGLAKVAAVLGAPDPSASRQPSEWFRLASFDQVFVGNVLHKSYGGSGLGMEHALHGLNPRDRGRDNVLEMGDTRPRQASPMLWRVFPCKGEGAGYIPVLTWSPLKATCIMPSSGQMATYLAGLGFSSSLAGNLLTCSPSPSPAPRSAAPPASAAPPRRR